MSGPPVVQRLDHVALKVSDREQSIAWYRDVLGLAPHGVATQDDWPVFVGELGACLTLFQAQSGSAAREVESVGLRHVAFAVTRDGLERAREHLRERSVEYRFEDHGNSRSVYFDDPDGHVIELTTYEV